MKDKHFPLESVSCECQFCLYRSFQHQSYSAVYVLEAVTIRGVGSSGALDH